MLNIATVTLNPTIDVAYSLDRLAPTDKLRAPPQQSEPGGGGINVARVFVRMGGNARCIYLSGGPSGIALDALLDRHQLVRERVPIAGDTRICTTIFEGDSAQEFRIVPAGPAINESEWQAALHRIETISCDYLVLSGSLPGGVPSDFYAKAARIAQERNLKAVLDTSGDALAAALEVGGFELVKPNLRELQQLLGREITDPAEIAEAAQDLVRKGAARLVAVTLGERGGILASADGVLHASAPEVDALSSVGAGDSCVAGMVYGLAAGKSDAEAFRLGIAAGGAALITPGTGLARREDIETLFALSNKRG